MKNRRMFCFLSMLLVVWAGVLLAAEEVARPLDIELSIISGQVKLTRNGKTDVLSASKPLFEKDLIEAGHDTKAELRYTDGTIMRMKSLSKIELRATSLLVARGQTWFKFTKRGTEFLIETPSMVAGIRGTEFEVVVDSRGKSILSVTEGSVAVRGNAEKEMIIDAGFATSCRVNGRPTRPIHFNVEKKNAAWQSLEWSMESTMDVDKLFTQYTRLSTMYGDNDSRTIAAKNRLEAAQKSQKRKSGNK